MRILIAGAGAPMFRTRSDSNTSPEEKRETQRKLTLRRLQFEMLMEKRGSSLAIREYQAKLEARFSD